MELSAVVYYQLNTDFFIVRIYLHPGACPAKNSSYTSQAELFVQNYPTSSPLVDRLYNQFTTSQQAPSPKNHHTIDNYP